MGNESVKGTLVAVGAVCKRAFGNCESIVDAASLWATLSKVLEARAVEQVAQLREDPDYVKHTVEERLCRECL